MCIYPSRELAFAGNFTPFEGDTSDETFERAAKIEVEEEEVSY